MAGAGEYTKYFVNEFPSYNTIQELNILIDCFFTSVFIHLAAWFLENKFNIVNY